MNRRTFWVLMAVGAVGWAGLLVVLLRLIESD